MTITMTAGTIRSGALIATITDPLVKAQLKKDLEELDLILEHLFGSDRMAAYDALGAMEDLLADISQLPESSEINWQEWVERKTDFNRAAELYLDGWWKQPAAQKTH
jgi:hypothetical protein